MKAKSSSNTPVQLSPKRHLLIAGMLITCLTNLQFSQALAQSPAPNQSNLPSGPTKQLFSELATPSILVAPQKGFMIDSSYLHREEEVQIKNIEGNATSSSDTGSLSVAYGLNSSFYLGTSMNYQTGKQKSDFALAGQGSIQLKNKEGVSDPQLFAGYRWNGKKISVISQLDAQISTGSNEEKRKPEQVTELNNKSGGSVYTPSLSVFTNNKSEFILGSTLAYQVRQERKTTLKDPTGFQSEGKTTGGNTTRLDFFAETPQSTHSLGAVLTWNKSESEKRISLQTTEVAGSEILSGTAYANLRASENISIIPAFSYSYFMNDKNGDIDLKSQSIYSGALTLRLGF
jgi:hypothetical protein